MRFTLARRSLVLDKANWQNLRGRCSDRLSALDSQDTTAGPDNGFHAVATRFRRQPPQNGIPDCGGVQIANRCRDDQAHTIQTSALLMNELIVGRRSAEVPLQIVLLLELPTRCPENTYLRR